MQTFLPVPNFKESAQYLDYKRLGKQRLEVKQLYEAIVTQSGRTYSHPAAKMWIGYTDALLYYGMAICDRWSSMDYKDNHWLQFNGWLECDNENKIQLPPWLGSPRFHASHRSNLLRKFPEHYKQFGWLEVDSLPYFWPDANYDWRKYEC